MGAFGIGERGRRAGPAPRVGCMSELVLIANAGDGTVSALRLHRDGPEGTRLESLATSPVGQGVGTFAIDTERDLVYARAKGELDSHPFGTELDVYSDEYEWMSHSMAPVMAPDRSRRGRPRPQAAVAGGPVLRPSWVKRRKAPRPCRP